MIRSWGWRPRLYASARFAGSVRFAARWGACGCEIMSTYVGRRILIQIVRPPMGRGWSVREITGHGSDEPSPRSGRKRKAWGASPRIRKAKIFGAREAGDSLKSSRCRPLARAILGLAPQALRFRPLRGLSPFCYAVWIVGVWLRDYVWAGGFEFRLWDPRWRCGWSVREITRHGPDGSKKPGRQPQDQKGKNIGL